jgi:hypothetical protein
MLAPNSLEFFIIVAVVHGRQHLHRPLPLLWVRQLGHNGLAVRFLILIIQRNCTRNQNSHAVTKIRNPHAFAFGVHQSHQRSRAVHTQPRFPPVLSTGRRGSSGATIEALSVMVIVDNFTDIGIGVVAQLIH